MITHAFSPAVDRARECEKPVCKNRRAKQLAMNQKTRCSAPIHTTDSVDCENSQATGAKPTSRMVMSSNKPPTRPQISLRRACEPLRQANIYKLGRQMSAEIINPPAILTGAAQSCVPIEKLPTTAP